MTTIIFTRATAIRSKGVSLIINPIRLCEPNMLMSFSTIFENMIKQNSIIN